MQLEHLLGNERFKRRSLPFKENFPQSEMILEGSTGHWEKKTAAWRHCPQPDVYRPTAPLCGRCGGLWDGRRFHPGLPGVRTRKGQHPGGRHPAGAEALLYPAQRSAAESVRHQWGGQHEPQAQNALLKVLESPRKQYFCCCANRQGSCCRPSAPLCALCSGRKLLEQIRQELQRRMQRPFRLRSGRGPAQHGGSLGRGSAGWKTARTKGRIGEPVWRP